MRKNESEIEKKEAKESALSGYFRNDPPFIFEEDKKIAEIVSTEDKYKRNTLK
jgi:hypothetical protein